MEIEKDVAVVTGGANGIGREIVRALVTNGYKVCIADIEEDTGELLVKELQGDAKEDVAIFRKCDVTKLSDYEELFQVVLQKFGKIDVVVNNAGIFDELESAKLVDINLMGVINGCQTAIKCMGTENGGKGGIVVNTASILGLVPHMTAPIYAATKFGVVGLTRSYGTDFHFKKTNLTFCAFCPWLVDTRLIRGFSSNSCVQGLDVTTRSDVMKPDYVAKGVLKLIKDKRNGSMLMITPRMGYMYHELDEVLKMVAEEIAV